MDNGIKVKTNTNYYKRYKRVMYGVVETEVYKPNDAVTPVRIMHQTGNVMHDMHEQLVLLCTDDLEEVFG